MIQYTIVVNNAVSDLFFFFSCLTETKHLRLNYALNLESSVQSVVEVPEVHLGASVNGK